MKTYIWLLITWKQVISKDSSYVSSLRVSFLNATTSHEERRGTVLCNGIVNYRYNVVRESAPCNYLVSTNPSIYLSVSLPVCLITAYQSADQTGIHNLVLHHFDSTGQMMVVHVTWVWVWNAILFNIPPVMWRSFLPQIFMLWYELASWQISTNSISFGSCSKHSSIYTQQVPYPSICHSILPNLSLHEWVLSSSV